MPAYAIIDIAARQHYAAIFAPLHFPTAIFAAIISPPHEATLLRDTCDYVTILILRHVDITLYAKILLFFFSR